MRLSLLIYPLLLAFLLSYGDAASGSIAIEEASFIDAKKTYEEKCQSCHGQDGKGGSSMVSLTTPMPEKKLASIIHDRMPLQDTKKCQHRCAMALSRYIKETFWQPDSKDTCDSKVMAPKWDTIRRLTPSQLFASIHEIFGSKIFLRDLFEKKPQKDEHAKAKGHISLAELERYMLAASRVSSYVAQNVHKVAPCKDALLERRCAERFIKSYGERLYRYPLERKDKESLMLLYAKGAQKKGYSGGISLALEAMLQSPRFLYHIESPLEAHLDYVIASRLSFLLWGQSPDTALLAAAREGVLSQKEGFSQQVSRLMQDKRAKERFRLFFYDWFDLQSFTSLEKDTDKFPSWQPEIIDMMARQMDAFFDDMAGPPLGNISSLFKTPLKDYAPEGLRQGWYANRDGFDYGLLTLPALLSVHAKEDESFPIYRGLFARQNLLCQKLPPPPTGVAEPSGQVPGQSTRDRFSAHSKDPKCAGCHQKIDPLGFALEHFDAIGRFRYKEEPFYDVRVYEAEDCDHQKASILKSDLAFGGRALDLKRGHVNCYPPNESGHYELSFLVHNRNKNSAKAALFINGQKVGVLEALQKSSYTKMTMKKVFLEEKLKSIGLYSIKNERSFHVDRIIIKKMLHPGHTIDASGELTGTDVDGPFDDMIALSDRLAESEIVAGCAVKKWFSYAMARQEVKQDLCYIKNLTKKFKDSGYQFETLRSEFLKTAIFLERK